MTLLWLADELRKAGLTVVEHSGWKTHHVSGSWSPTYGVVHATAAPRSQADSVQVRVVRYGRADLDGPIANAVVRRDGVWVVTSAGRCNSTLTGTAGPYKGRGNTNALSVEGCNDNRGEPWPDVQYRSYVRGWAAWCKRLGWKADRLVGHKEHTPGRKSDPSFNMDRFRADVAAVLAGEDDGVSAQDVVKALETPVKWQSKGVADLAKSMGLSEKDTRSLIEMGFEKGVLSLAATLRVEANLKTLMGKDFVNEREIIDGVLGGLGSQDLETAAGALRAAFGDRAAELGALLGAAQEG